MDALSSFVLSFFVLHLFITNKEYRFLFPILNLVPFMAAFAFQSFTDKVQKKPLILLYAAISLIGFSVSSLRGASVETLWPIHVVNQYAKPGEVWLTNRDYMDQFIHGYYQLPGHQILIYHDGAELDRLITAQPNSKVLVDGYLKDTSTQTILDTIAKRGCTLVTSARPLFLFELRKYYSGIDRLTFKAVYQCN